ncbi:ferrous iron transport protein B [Desulfoplanes formicivorans]|uniref:Ferrous iron transport protein B n=1 Tax=Desulfoplanes formicivorans TaxID=1592317 RepID=A0A194AFW9_9BACT|nr:ferrous iron transport protein B [Desulfoplanes formicivorans]GAU07664.1 iron transporter FeoB [Desulfoplanes formicivorans]
MDRTIRVALAGNPNCGKSTTFNAITGSKERVGNYPGITVERKEGCSCVHGATLRIIDLPGTYSLTAYSMEELVARQVLVDEKPELAIDVVDATALERSLYLAVQLMELGVPVVLSMNMMDEVRQKGIHIHTRELSARLGVPVVETVAKSGKGIGKLLKTVVDYAQSEAIKEFAPLHIPYGPDLDGVIQRMVDRIEEEQFLTERYPARFIAVKYLENDESLIKRGRSQGELGLELEAMAKEAEAMCERDSETYPEAVIADYRYAFINDILKDGVLEIEPTTNAHTRSDRIDAVLTHQILGPALMLGILYLMFTVTIEWGAYPQELLIAGFEWFGDVCTRILPDGLLQSLVVSGIVDGVGGVLSFVPLILIMFFMLTFLEDLGYMARMAYMMDRVFRFFGLHGSSVMPFIISGGIPGGCAVPGIMSARTLRSPKERLATLVVSPFMMCGAKLPLFIMMTAAFFPGSAARVMLLFSLGAWAVALLTARILRWAVIRGEPTPFVMELPPYRMPALSGLWMHTWERTWQYIKKAGTVILAISILIWAAMTFPRLPAEKIQSFDARVAAVMQDQQLSPQEQEMKINVIRGEQAEMALRNTVAGRIGDALLPATSLAGFNWKMNIAVLGGFAAKEVIVSTLGTAYSMAEVDPENPAALGERLKSDPHWTIPAVIGCMTFILLYAPCFVTVIAMARESSWKWAVFAVVFNTLLAYILAVIIYQAGSAMSG